MAGKENKKILLITRYFPPLDAIATQRMYCWAKYLQRQGYDISVLTTSKDKQVVIPLKRDLSKFDVFEVPYFDPISRMGIDKKALLASGDAPSSSALKTKIKQRCARFYRERMNERMPGRTDFWIIPAIRELKKRKREGRSYDYVISSYGPPSAHVVAYFAKGLFGATWLADYRDLWIENHTFAGVWPFTLLEKIIEAKVVGHADVVTTVSDPWNEILQKKFPHIQVHTVPNGFDPEAILDISGAYFDKEPKKCRIVYTGSIYRGLRDPSPLFQAIRELLDEKKIAEDSLEVLFYGSNMSNLAELIQECHVEGIARYCGAVGFQDVLSIQKSVDALLFLEAHNPDLPGVLPGKLFEYLCVDTPIIGVGIKRDSTSGELIERVGAGVVCGIDVNLIKETLQKLLEGKFQVKRQRELIMSYSRENQAKRIAELLEEVHSLKDRI